MDGGDLPGEVVRGGGPGRRRHGHVGAERELRIDRDLLVVGGGEDPQVHPEGQQQPYDHETAVDRRAAASRADEQEGRPRRGPAADRAGEHPGEGSPPQPDEQ